MTVLVPSYAEEPEVVSRHAVVGSAAGVPASARRAAARRPARARPTRPSRHDSRRPAPSPTQIEACPRRPRARFRRALDCDWEVDPPEPASTTPPACRARFSLRGPSEWLEHAWPTTRRSTTTSTSSSSSQVLRGLAAEFALTRRRTDAAARRRAQHFGRPAHVQLYRRLAWTFDAELATFERKTLRLALARGEQGDEPQRLHRAHGRRIRRRRDPGGHGAAPGRLRPKAADLVIPDSDYLLTLDADSMLLRDYCLRLVYLLEQPEQRARRGHPDAVLRRSAGRAPASSGSPARPPTSSTSCTRG